MRYDNETVPCINADTHEAHTYVSWDGAIVNCPGVLPKYFATKYDSARDEVIAILADYNEGFGAAQSGDAESPTGYFQLVHLTEECDLDFTDHTNYPLGDYAGEVARTYGVTHADVLGHYIVTTDSQGFVYVQSYDSARDARQAFDSLADAYASWCDDGEGLSEPV